MRPPFLTLAFRPLPLHAFKVATATIISLWMAALACFMGCTLPALANSGSSNISSIRAALIRVNLSDQSQSQPMANMEHCHHSGSKSPAAPNHGQPVPGSGMSCCPLEITVAPKPHAAPLAVAPAPDFVLPSHFVLPTIRFYDSVEFVPTISHSGRDTLLKTSLLRI
jgi:hypothetical protein